MPVYAVALMLSGATLIAVLRILTWILRAIGYRQNPRPGYLDLSSRRKPR